MEPNPSSIDPVDDLNLDLIPFFGKVRRSLLRKRPIPVLHMRDQGNTHTCWGHVVTATMYGEEVSRVGCSDEGSRQELLDYIYMHKRPRSTENKSGPFVVPPKGFCCSYPVSYSYVVKYGVSTARDYPWDGVAKSTTYSGSAWDGKVLAGGTVPIDREDKIFIKGYSKLSSHEEIERHLEKQPVAACIMLTSTLVLWSSEEIYKGVDGGRNIGKHAITLVGYGNEGDDHYYLCQNSFGLKWGYKGYFKVARDLIEHGYVPLGTESPTNRKKKKDDSVDVDVDVDVDVVGDADISGRMGSRARKRRRKM